MEDLKIIKECQVSLDKARVMEWMDCRSDSPVYEEVAELYDQVEEEIKALCRPVVLLKFGQLEADLEPAGIRAGAPAVYGLCSIGEEISRRSTEAFAQGDGLLGMMINTMADLMLFGLENEIQEMLKKECGERNMGILRRLEAPQDMPMEMQKVIHVQTKALELAGIGLTSGYMFDPVKSNGIVFLLTKDAKIFRAQHDCRNCTRTDCPMRRESDALVTVLGRDEAGSKLKVPKGKSILDAMLEAGEEISAVCGKRGVCGKCRIRVAEGVLACTDADKRYFTEEELEKGWRLACMAYPASDITIETGFRKESGFRVLSAHDTQKTGEKDFGQESLGVAVDIGTTTLAMQLVGFESHRVIHTCTGLNRQRAYGADVVSRIQASIEGKRKELRNSIRQDLTEGLQRLIAESGAEKSRIEKMAVAANTTMIHLLMGYSCETLGVYPFTPVSVGLIRTESREILDDPGLDIPVFLLPGVSAFVGGDIAAGLFSCGFDASDEISLLIDLGTNGEMAIGNRERILCTSTAAGPAFEGGNIRWGTGSIPGAISGVTIGEEGPACRTIGDKKPVGICGTGVIETVSELVRTELVEDTGLLEEDFFGEGYPLAKTEAGEPIVFTQQDIREIQLAKAAVRAGMETLILRYGIEKSQITKVYLAGGFGFQLDLKKAVAIGMFPEELEQKMVTVGNSALGGAVKFLKDQDSKKRILELVGKAAEINLSADRSFNEYYMEYMFFA